MSMAQKILFSGPEGSANISGLLEALRRTSPAPMMGLELSGGRIQGHPMADDSDTEVRANDARVTKAEKRSIARDQDACD